ncbi:MAG: hypothetical protein E5Y79_01905 [Mesorhizobium sp.]|uniref:hypothetical protein n=1 Tax=Mesorhizobium sp. TaxID=1871066 RepID=UPI00120DD9E0|nr:hypothetical protein [Mesorhizobium sp.]TIL62927.1 MAG: hypothetical protein E5Y79_01905 [Mesorhizobium sp.]
MGQLSREQKTAATDLQVVICQFRPGRFFDSTDKATQRQTLAVHSDIGRPSIAPGADWNKSVPALFSNRPDVRRGWFIRWREAILAAGVRRKLNAGKGARAFCADEIRAVRILVI